MADRHHLFISLILILTNSEPIASATFENISLILKWRTGIQDRKIVNVTSDNTLRNYVGEFGEVIVEKQNVPKLREDSVSNLAKVTHLHLTECGIKEIEAGAFRNLPMLTDLNLSGNLLEEIKNGVFANVRFSSLYLENNRIARIDDAAFNRLKMEYLFIDDNRISEWRSEWFLGTPLRSISMRNNKLESLSRLSFEYLWHLDGDVILENFILSNNRLKSIDPDAFEGVEMIFSLNLQNNSLIHLEPGVFDSVKAIDMIDLSSNQLTELYYESFRNTRVLQLNVFDNLVTCVPAEILNLTRLNVLNVDNNPISCDCVQIWRKWKEDNVKPEISNFENLKRRCRRSSGAKNSVKFSLILLGIVVRFWFPSTNKKI